MYYVIKDFAIDELYVNPENARFINPDEVLDEVSAINEIIGLNPSHVVDLAKDIAINGLNPNELPIVMQDLEENKVFIMDGNRRISSIKLMTQYKDRLDDMKLDSISKRELSSLKCDLKNIRCVFCTDENEVNYLLEKLHTSKPGISQVKWDPQAQDRHNHKNGIISKRLSIIKMLNCSEYTTSEAKAILNEKGWLSKLKRFTPNKYIKFFGIRFTSENNIFLLIDESEVMKGLSKLVIDLKNTKADDIAQKEEARNEYLDSFDLDKRPDLSKLVSPLIMFDANSEKFIETSTTNELIVNLFNIEKATNLTTISKPEGDGQTEDSTLEVENNEIIEMSNPEKRDEAKF